MFCNKKEGRFDIFEVILNKTRVCNFCHYLWLVISGVGKKFCTEKWSLLTHLLSIGGFFCDVMETKCTYKGTAKLPSWHFLRTCEKNFVENFLPMYCFAAYKYSNLKFDPIRGSPKHKNSQNAMKKSDIFVLFFKCDNVKVSSQEKLGILIFIIWFLTFPFFFIKRDTNMVDALKTKNRKQALHVPAPG